MDFWKIPFRLSSKLISNVLILGPFKFRLVNCFIVKPRRTDGEKKKFQNVYVYRSVSVIAFWNCFGD